MKKMVLYKKIVERDINELPEGEVLIKAIIHHLTIKMQLSCIETEE